HRLARALLSFPTRRSSDLAGMLTGIGLAFVNEGHLKIDHEQRRRSWAHDIKAKARPCPINEMSGEGDPMHDLKLLFSGMVHQVRSEEHTSELQSRENLVCR